MKKNGILSKVSLAWDIFYYIIYSETEKQEQKNAEIYHGNLFPR